MGVRLRHLARMTAIFNPFSEAVANIGDHCGWCASMSGHGPSWHSCVGCSQPVHRSTLVDATGARTHMAKLSWHADFVVSVVCRRTQRPSSGSGEAPWVSSRVCHWKVQIFCERIHSVSREPECSRSQIFTSGFSFAAPGDMVCVYMLDGTGRKGWCCAHESLEAVVACKLVLEGFFCWEVNGGPSEASGKDDSNL